MKEIADTEKVSKTSKSLNIQEIMEYLPHRYPFLLVDKVLDLNVEQKTIRAVKNVTINEPFFNGHFPGKPVMPGVLQIEAMAQAAGILMLDAIGVKGKIALFMSCDKAKFRKVVTAGDQLVIEAEMTKMRAGKMGVATAKCLVDGGVVSSADITFALVDEI